MKIIKMLGFSFFSLLALLSLFFGCKKEGNSPVSALLVLEEVPRRISTGFFDEKILGNQVLTGAELKYLKSAYKPGRDAYTINLQLHERPREGRTHRDEIIRIFRKIGMILLFDKSSDSKPASFTREWKLVECLDFEIPRKEAFRREGAGEEILEWHKIKMENHEYWVSAGNLLFKNMEETEGVALRSFDLFKYPIFDIASRIGRFTRGIKVRSMGFIYPERVYKSNYIYVEVYDKAGWCPVQDVVLGARNGVMKADAALFDNPEDIKSNRSANGSCEKMDLVPIIEMRKDGWAKVVIDSGEKYYYIKNGKDLVSDDPLDIAFSSYVREDYKRSKAIYRELSAALRSGDKAHAIAITPNIKGKLSSLDSIRRRLEEFISMDEYKNSSFVRSGSPSSLSSYTQELFEIVNESQYLLGLQSEEDEQVESKKGSRALESASE